MSGRVETVLNESADRDVFAQSFDVRFSLGMDYGIPARVGLHRFIVPAAGETGGMPVDLRKCRKDDSGRKSRRRAISDNAVESHESCSTCSSVVQQMRAVGSSDCRKPGKWCVESGHGSKSFEAYPLGKRFDCTLDRC